MNSKQFAKDHKKELIIAGVVAGVAVVTVITIKLKKNPLKNLTADDISKLLSENVFHVKDLPKPSWDGVEIIEHWNEMGAQNMILNCHVCDLGKLGENLMNDLLTQANPDIPIEMILSYGSSCWVN